MYTLGQILWVLHWRKITYALSRRATGDHNMDCITFIYRDLIVNISVFAGYREGFQPGSEYFDTLQISVDRTTPVLTIKECRWLGTPNAAIDILAICDGIVDHTILTQPKPGRPKNKK